ncbi:hypothetical protein H4R33_000023 [Dimargaris cristalligena]|uniref:ETC complex I subunit conserved region-domain-containing protein n=1 Tax=Dimargaris cristalligena TaxID=215637 RepID=A0A4Q0A094_9FUNG|nr:hypothetical protein H4R33_000023 [Dimargaris cristalligena]RKP39407.1 ETC complex I subunit conserved region-domain-containing protein [Dimargaris cristalligena]|eukprot:RKP39407.1 ETC complex I subunit conserved region-domain-containing protein [Dimargaris cristalligena]
MQFTRSLFQVVQKATTGLRGIEVHPNPRPVLIDLYRKTLTELETQIPEHAIYRQATAALTKHRLAIVERESDVAQLEASVNGGQIEELIMAAEDELKLIPKMAEAKPWEPLQEPAPTGQWVYFEKKQAE